MNQNTVEQWKQRSEIIAAKVREVASLDEAFQYILDLCQNCAPREQLMEDASKGDKTKMLAAPGLPAEQAEQLRKGCKERGIRFVETKLRDYTGGIEVGVTWCVAALADTGSCILNSTNEDERLATMLPETSVLLVPRSKILSGSDKAAPLLRQLMEGDKPSFIAYVSGPSRTADIERVLTLGVHGPLELHALLIPDEA